MPENQSFEKFDGTNLSLRDLIGRDYELQYPDMRTRGPIAHIGIDGDASIREEPVLTINLRWVARQLPRQNFWLLFEREIHPDRGARYGNFPLNDFYFSRLENGLILIKEKREVDQGMIHPPEDNLDFSRLKTLNEFYGVTF